MLAAFFLYRQQQIRHEMKEKLEQVYLHTVIIPAKDLIWVKYKKEIRVGDRLFDVKSMTLINDQYHCKGLYDDDETALKKFFASTQHQPTDKNKSGVSVLFKLLQSFYPVENREQLFTPALKQTCSPALVPKLPSPFTTILTPPPQI